MNETVSKRSAEPHRFLTLKLIGLCAAMFAFGFALVPLYDVLCKVTGLGGKTSGAPAAVVEAVDESRTVQVEFVATLGRHAPLEFRPNVSRMEVHPGKLYETTFYARNLTEEPLTAQAVPSVAPGLAARHFKKVECFCFTSQTFGPGEGRDMTLQFMVASELPAHQETVSLSYMMFELTE